MENLTEQQKRAAESSLERNCLVTAGPGSGKTFFLVHRVARILSNCPGSKVYCISFTNESARELNRRLCGLKSVGQVICSTIHRFCLQGLKSLKSTDSEPLRVLKGNSSFVKYMRGVVSSSECRRLVQLLGDNELDSGANEASAGEDSEGTENSTAEEETMVGLSLSDEQLYTRLIEACRKVHFCHMRGDISLKELDFLKGVSERFYEALKKESVIDLSTIVSEFLFGSSLLKGFVRSVCDYILVDEFQDLDNEQLRLLHALADIGVRITAVGDPNQSIYSWRLREGKRAKLGTNFDEFPLHFFSESDQPDSFKLTLNLRSTPDIVRFSNNLINSFVSTTENVKKGIVCGLLCRHVYDETARLADLIKFIQSRNELSCCAVLFRYNAEREKFVKQLTKLEIPFHGKLCSVANGPITVKRTKSLRDLLTVLKAGSTWDLTACEETLIMACSGKEEIGEMEKLLQNFDKSECEQSVEKRLAGIVHSKSESFKLKALISSVLVKLRSVGKRNNSSEAIEAGLSGFKIKRTKDIKDFVSKAKNLDSVSDVLKMIEESDLAYCRSKTTRQGIFVGTIHAAKGREWKTVILPFVNEKSLPSERADVEEERRVMYVGMTRSVDTLLITCNQSAGPSRFIKDAKIPLIRNVNEFISLYTSTR